MHWPTSNNTKEQFANSPDLTQELKKAVMDSYDAHASMSTRALNQSILLRGLLDILLNHSGLLESLRARAVAGSGQSGSMGG